MDSLVLLVPRVIEVIEGFSTDIELPERVDLLVCEIAGSIASEEGMYATIGDARRRFMQRRPLCHQLTFAVGAQLQVGRLALGRQNCRSTGSCAR